jgi:hypothetical protein
VTTELTPEEREWCERTARRLAKAVDADHDMSYESVLAYLTNSLLQHLNAEERTRS